MVGNKPVIDLRLKYFIEQCGHIKKVVITGFLKDNSETAVYALPEKSVVGPDAI